jgi:hypothetical protein
MGMLRSRTVCPRRERQRAEADAYREALGALAALKRELAAMTRTRRFRV